ncbi:hypothetical protein J1G42_07725 [Cellulomonas sp. zg-ZUI222]|uniref:hypothetical protein n=1 Tax=Cellulomonas wangleii TaxID=2816956 RepID=UPI001A953186|nr:hypothetical protein [Cellulomonas wangleii]MBO0920713.1 hypothetical protein [Cellulomonas wangleii]
MTFRGARRRTVDSNSLGWPAYAFMVAFCWLGSWAFLEPPWLYVSAVGGTVAVGVLAVWLRSEHLVIEISGATLTREEGRGPEVFEMSDLIGATFHWIPFYGSVIDLEWSDGRALEVPVVWGTREFRAQLAAAVRTGSPAAALNDPGSARALRRAGLL